MKADKQATEARHFKDERSYVANRQHPGTEHSCIYIFGLDIAPFREEIYRRDEGHCKLRIACSGEKVLPIDGSIFERWHLEHEQGGLGQSRCWCHENVRGACYECHKIKDGRYPRWTKKERANA